MLCTSCGISLWFLEGICVCLLLRAHAQHLEKSLMCSADTSFPLLHSCALDLISDMLPFCFSY